MLEAIKEDEYAWAYFQQFSDSYKKIRIAYIDVARKRPDEFARCINKFMRSRGMGN